MQIGYRDHRGGRSSAEGEVTTAADVRRSVPVLLTTFVTISKFAGIFPQKILLPVKSGHFRRNRRAKPKRDGPGRGARFRALAR
jgi:hypothetical protein